MASSSPSHQSSPSGPAGAATPAAPWRAPFLKNVTEMSSPEFTLATIHAGPTPTSTSTAGQHQHQHQPSLSPRTRTVIFRGLWASLPVNPKNTAELNPPVYESDMLTLTTDARMAKVADFFGPGSGSGSGFGSGSGGGAPVEACFWTDARVQWRVRGDAYVLGPDIEDPSSPAAAALREKLLSRMRRRLPEDEDEARGERTAKDLVPPEVRDNVVDADAAGGSGWSFARELTAHFGNLSPAMRGTFRNPEPGAPREANPPDGTHRLGQKVEDLHDAAARANFRVVVVAPTEVDQTDLSDAEDPRRWLYRLVGGEGERDGAEKAGRWEKIETWP